jgi:4-hydroxy-3-methylbut-2-enyl diphosphate reductase
VLSAHGVAPEVYDRARQRALTVLDATCPLVFKVHFEAQRKHSEGYQILLIGHAGHPEVVGTMGQLPDGAVTLIETVHDANTIELTNTEKLAFVTQTTLSVDDTAAIVEALKARFPAIVGPHKEDICYATTNRQAAVKEIAPRADWLLVVGAPNSSNSLRLVEVAERAGCPHATLVQRAADIPFDKFGGISTIAITAGASAPEVLVDETIAALKERYDVSIEVVTTAEENIAFNIPRELRDVRTAETA